MPRTSKRKASLQASKRLAAQDSADDGEADWESGDEVDDNDGGEEEYVRPSPKKARKSTGGSTSKRVKGSLRGILSLPAELVALVASNLDLPTLFHLSRLNKRFYSFLRDPQIEYVWEAARETSGLPTLTAPGMDTVGLANLLFGCCKGCGKATTKVDYVLRIRSCQACSKELIVDERDFVGPPYGSKVRSRAVRSLYQGTGSRNYPEFSAAEIDFLQNVVSARYGEGVVSAQEMTALHPVASKPYKTAKLSSDGFSDVRKTRRLNFETAAFSDHALVNVAKELTDSGESSFLLSSSTTSELYRLFRASSMGVHGGATPASHAVDLLGAGSGSPLEGNAPRRGLVLTRYRELVKDRAMAKTCGLWPVCNQEDFAALPTVEALYRMKTYEDTTKPPPKLDDHLDAIKTDLTYLMQVTTRKVFDQVHSNLTLLDEHRATDAAKASNSFATSPSTAPAKLTPTPADGSDFTVSEIDTFLCRAMAVARCAHCQQVDILPRLFTHCCTFFHNVSGRRYPSFASGNYKVSLALTKAAVAVVEVSDKPIDVSAAELDTLGHGYSCTNPGCVVKIESRGLFGGGSVGRSMNNKLLAGTWHRLVAHLTVRHYCRGYYNDHYVEDPPEAMPVLEDRQAVLERLYRDKHEALHGELE
ncbi:hypothetical protein JCM8547_007242 [Rhodosporidiobolus lusitaniae]